MVICCVVGCSNKSGGQSVRQKEKEKKQGRRTSYHVFPSDKNLRQIWIDAVKRENWVPTQSSVVCSEHFTEDCYDSSPFYRKLKNASIPSIFPSHYIKSLTPIKEEPRDEPNPAELLEVEEQPPASRNISPVPIHNSIEVKSEKLASPCSEPIPATDNLVISNVISCSDQQRTPSFVPSGTAYINNYKFQMSQYRKKIKSLQQKTRRQDRRIAKLQTLVRELQRKK